eukprot:604850-Ditylum_brightwellii.AAC.1
MDTVRVATIGSCEVNTGQHHKSRTPQLNDPRLAETFATDRLFSSEPGLCGVTCTQLFIGTSSKLAKVFGMKTENEGPDMFEDFI